MFPQAIFPFYLSCSSAIGAENIFKRWTQKVEHPVEIDGPEHGNKPAERELRPFRQRAVVSLAIVGFGTGLGILFLSGRSRIVKRMHGIFPPTVNSSKRNVIPSGQMTHLALETFGSFSAKEVIFPKELCQIVIPKSMFSPSFVRLKGPLSFRLDKNELRLKVRGKTVYWLGLDNATIDGQLMPDTTAAQGKLSELIERKRVSKWKSGPVIQNT